MLSREMPVKACAEFIGVTDKRVWRVIKHYVSMALLEMNLSELKAIGLDETASKRGHNYVTVFIDMDRTNKPVLFATPGKGKQTVKDFKAFLEGHQSKAENILEVICDMSIKHFSLPRPIKPLAGHSRQQPYSIDSSRSSAKCHTLAKRTAY